MVGSRFQVWGMQEGSLGFNDYEDDDRAERQADRLVSKETTTDVIIVDTHDKVVNVLKGSVDPFADWLEKRVPGWRLNGSKEEE